MVSGKPCFMAIYCCMSNQCRDKPNADAACNASIKLAYQPDAAHSGHRLSV
jgi:hypothetical protein